MRKNTLTNAINNFPVLIFNYYLFLLQLTPQRLFESSPAGCAIKGMGHYGQLMKKGKKTFT